MRLRVARRAPEPDGHCARGRFAHIVARRDSFVAEFTPNRAGTFIYHSHSNDYFQIASGLAAPLLVLDAGTPYDSTRDLTFLINQDGFARRGRVNGTPQPDTVRLAAGTRYRLRFIDIAPDWRVFVTLAAGASPVRWRAVAKDGADLPPQQAVDGRAFLPMGPGETADFEFRPTTPGRLSLEIATQIEGWDMAVAILVTPAGRRRPAPRRPPRGPVAGPGAAAPPGRGPARP